MSHRITRFTVAREPEGLTECPLNLYQWERTDSGHSLVLTDGAAYEMHLALVGREGVSETDITDDYIIGTTAVDHGAGDLGTYMLAGDTDNTSTVAVLRTNLERVLCELHDFTPLQGPGTSFVPTTMALLADRIEAHIAKSEEHDDVALLDAVEMARTMRAILNRDVMFVSNMSAPLQRAKRAINGSVVSIWSPDVRWPSDRKSNAPTEMLVRGVDDEGEPQAMVKLEAVTPMGAATAFFSQCFYNVCIVRSDSQEIVFVRRVKGEIHTESEWAFERSGPLLCPRPEHDDGDHVFVETSVEVSEEQPGHPAARRGISMWLVCHHCDAWADYYYGEGITEAVDEALALAPPVKS